MRVVFTGPESSGKTSVSKEVASLLQGAWFPEYAREYLLQLSREYTFEDIEKIARKQEEIRKTAAKGTTNVFDTGVFVLYIWSMYKYGKCSSFITNLFLEEKEGLYFLCSPEGIKWEEDPLREHPTKRKELFNLYQEELEQRNRNYFVLEGSFEERVKQALKVIHSHI